MKYIFFAYPISMNTSDFGMKVDNSTRERILERVFAELNAKFDPDFFLGSHPVSLTSKSIQTLLENDYFVCEKSDGIRVILIAYDGFIYLYDRNCAVYATKYALNRIKDLFVFDGELFNEEESAIYAIFDCLVFAGQCMTQKALDRRLQRGFEFCKKIISRSLIHNPKLPCKSFKITAKEMMKSYGFHQILDNIPNLKHENDGLIFTPLNDPYKVMTRTQIFKWKPPHLNTVDFYVIKSERTYEYKLYLYIEENQVTVSRKNFFSKMLFFSTYLDSNGTLGDGDVIAEFSYDPEKECIDYVDFAISKGGWKLYKIRTDKKTPNNIKVALNVLESIEESMDEVKLRSYSSLIAEKYNKRRE